MKYYLPIRLFALAAASLCAAVRPVAAHDILLLPKAEKDHIHLTIKYGHPADYTLPDQEKLFELNAYLSNGAATSLLGATEKSGEDTLAVKIDPTQFGAAGTGIIGARFDNGYFAEVDKKHYFNTSKRELPQAIKSGHYLKFAKGLVALSAVNHTGYDRPLGYRLELFPKADPFSLKPGDELPVLVLFDGKPLADAEVDVISGEFPMQKDMELPKFKTGADGIARVKIERPGFQTIGTDYNVKPSADPQLADEDNYASTFSFFLSTP